MDTFESSGRAFSDGGGNDLGESARMDEDSGSREEAIGEDLLSTENSQPEINIFYDPSEDDTCTLCLCAGPHLPTWGPCDACDCLEYVPVWSLDDDDCSTLLEENSEEDSLADEYDDGYGDSEFEEEDDLLDDVEHVASPLFPPDENSRIATNEDELNELAGIEWDGVTENEIYEKVDDEESSLPKS